MSNITKSKKTRPTNIWICNRADGYTSFGYYLRAKRRVLVEINTKEHLLKLDSYLYKDYPYNFKGDPLPHGWLTEMSRLGFKHLTRNKL